MKVEIDGLTEMIPLPQDLTSSLREMIRHSSLKFLLFDAHTFQLNNSEDDNFVVQTSSTPYAYTVSPETIKRFQKETLQGIEAASETLKDIVHQALINRSWILIDIPYKDLENFPTPAAKKEFLKEHIRYEIPDHYDWDSATFGDSEDPNAIRLKIFEKKPAEEQHL